MPCCLYAVLFYLYCISEQMNYKVMFSIQSLFLYMIVNLYIDIEIDIDIQCNLNGSNMDGSFAMGDSNYFLNPYDIFPIAQEKQIFRDIVLIYAENVCCVYSFESHHRDNLNKYTQHTIII